MVPGTWTPSTTLTDQWCASGAAISGATKSTLTQGTGQVGKTITVKVTGTKAGYLMVARISVAMAAVTYPTPPKSDGSCPGWGPIKGNADSMIYHVPGGQYDDVNKPRSAPDGVVRGGGQVSEVQALR